MHCNLSSDCETFQQSNTRELEDKEDEIKVTANELKIRKSLSIAPTFTEKSTTKEFVFLSVPKRVRHHDEKLVRFSYATTVVCAISASIIYANLYYCQPLLIEMAKSFDISYERVSRIPTFLQAGYAVSLFVICPLGDIARRRQLILSLMIITSFLTIGLAVTRNETAFQALVFVLGITNVAAQILAPLVVENAPLGCRAFAYSILVTGIMSGILFARIISGIIGQFAVWRIVYYASVALQCIAFALLYFILPDHPSKTKHYSIGRYTGRWSSLQ